MAYCESCSAELTDGVKFCKHCGARVGDLSDGAKEILFSDDETPEPQEPEFMSAEGFFNDENEDEADIEDGEVDDSKGLDPNRSYHMTMSGRSAELYNDWGQLIRRYNMRTNVVQATTSGEMVTICTDDGYTHVYKWDGTFVRRFH